VTVKKLSVAVLLIGGFVALSAGPVLARIYRW